jgi:arylsulfatase A-like enzyme/Flp pilus assembly protein TadD
VRNPGLLPLRIAPPALAAALAACGGGAAPGPPAGGVLLITVDTLRADHLGCYGAAGDPTPRIDRLAAEGVRIQDASTPVPITLPAHASLMTGVAPPVHGVRDNGDFRLGPEPPTLAAHLGEGGFATAAFVGAVVLDAAFGLDRGFGHYDDDVPVPADSGGAGASSYPDRPAAEVVDAALAWLQALPPGGPFFAWVHLFDPHAPYLPPEPQRGRYGATYRGEVAYVDEQVGRLLDGLEALGRAGDTLVVLTADHGEGLGEHGETTHGFFLYQATIHVPLLLRLPGRLPAGGRVEGAATLLDVAPTIAELAGRGPLPGAAGVSLVAAARGARLPDRPLYLETYLPYFQMRWSGSRGVRHGSWKYIAATGAELYDVGADPAERRDVAAERPETADRLAGALRDLAAAMAEGARAVPPPLLDGDDAARLRSLGYLAGGGGAPGDLAALAAARPDTRDRVRLVDRLLEAAPAAIDRRDPEGVRALEGIAREDPDNPRLLAILGKALLQHGRTGDAVRVLARAVDLDPGDPRARANLAGALLRDGRAAEARKAMDRAAAAGGADPEVRRMLAALWIDAGEPARAEAEFRALLRAHPDDRPALKGLGQALAARKDWPAALEALDAYLRRVPDAAEIRVLAGTAAYRMQRYDEAQRHLRGALEQQPDNLPALTGLGLVLGETGDDAGAARVLARAVSLAEDDPNVLTLYGVAAARSGDVEAGRRALRRSLRLKPDQPVARAFLDQIDG